MSFSQKLEFSKFLYESTFGIFCPQKACLTFHFRCFPWTRGARLGYQMDERTETRSEKARQVILKAEEKYYFVNKVSVYFCEDQKVHRATFHAQTVEDNVNCDLDFEIPEDLYDTLVRYTRVGDPDLILMLFHEKDSFKWSLISESWLKHYSNVNNVSQYVV